MKIANWIRKEKKKIWCLCQVIQQDPQTDRLIFNGMSTCLWLLYAYVGHLYLHCVASWDWGSGVAHIKHSYWIQIIFKQIYLRHRSLNIRCCLGSYPEHPIFFFFCVGGILKSFLCKKYSHHILSPANKTVFFIISRFNHLISYIMQAFSLNV